MSDAFLSIREETGTIDFSISKPGGILTKDFFDSMILVAIFEHKRASPDEVPTPNLRRGSIINELTPNFERGSKIWLCEQSRLTRSVMNKIISAADDCLAFMIEKGYALEIKNDIELNAGDVVLKVKIKKPNNEIENLFFTLWENSGITQV